MSAIPRAYIDRYNELLSELSERMGGRLAQRLTALEWADYDEALAEAVRLVQGACSASAEEAAYIAAEFYDGLRASQTGRRMGALADAVYNPDATEGAVEAFARQAGADHAAFAEKCASRLDYEVRRSANGCLASNARRDPKRPRWARVPDGAETCEWCIMLASRGFVYSSEDAAEHSHANCQCVVMPGWGDDPEVEGYDPDYYKDCYDYPEKHPEIRERINERRRELYAQRSSGSEAED